MKIIIASTNKSKIKGTENAFYKHFKDIDITGINVPSNVSDQPFDEEILKGVKNRIENLKSHLKENNLSADFLVAIESGIIELNKIFFAITIAVIEDKQGNQNWGTSSSFVIPPHLIPQIKETSLAEVYKSLKSPCVR